MRTHEKARELRGWQLVTHSDAIQWGTQTSWSLRESKPASLAQGCGTDFLSMCALKSNESDCASQQDDQCERAPEKNGEVLGKIVDGWT